MSVFLLPVVCQKRISVDNLLGVNVPFPKEYDPTILRAVPFMHRKGNTTEVALHCDEFTSLCPKTGQPDFAIIDITYTPREHIVETKSLKLYLGSFRNVGMFQEQITQTICADLGKLLDPAYLDVHSNFKARGGVAIEAKATFLRPIQVEPPVTQKEN